MAAKACRAADDIVFNTALFKRIEAVYQGLPAANLEPDQVRLTTRVYEHFVRRGAKLNADQKARLSAINQELAARFAEFRAKVLADENTWIVLERESDLDGLPASVVAAAKTAAEERGLAGSWAIVNTRSSVDPFLTFSTRRHLREIVWKKFKSRGDNGDANDTKAIIAAIVRLRAERARLLGFKSHAHWRMQDTMAVDPAVAQSFLLKVWPFVVARVRDEVADMQTLASREQPGITIEPWDYLYYAEKVRKAKYDLDEAEIKPYLQLDNMVSAALWSAERRFGIAFKEITGTVPVYHPDLRVWEVSDKTHGAASLCFLSGQLRPGRKALGGVGDQLPVSAHLRRTRDLHRIDQQQLREGSAGRAGAHLADRRGDAVSRIRSRAAHDAAGRQISRAFDDADGLRRTAVAAQRALAADP